MTGHEYAEKIGILFSCAILGFVAAAKLDSSSLARTIGALAGVSAGVALDRLVKPANSK